MSDTIKPTDYVIAIEAVCLSAMGSHLAACPNCGIVTEYFLTMVAFENHRLKGFKETCQLCGKEYLVRFTEPEKDVQPQGH